ncbi:hypothetical protein X560_0363 [Listeria fleischmannii 1991]|uniref:Uncharacterized protein n=1 Tax=Listeria fleischmannii 1991 TaxID=1430899 RepID=A0A0J8GJL8_9LIST|nr:hypothetical protein X560_0363 [Listeria fleischmannii 1991]
MKVNKATENLNSGTKKALVKALRAAGISRGLLKVWLFRLIIHFV